MAAMPSTSPDEPQPAWELATLWPYQGNWSEDDYLELTASTNRLIELTNGHLEFLPMPTLKHQLILQWLFLQINSFVRQQDLGLVVLAAIRVRLAPDHFREPDLVFMRSENRERAGDRYFESADLVMEVVSADPKSRDRDYQKKRQAYAKAGIPEYWIVDPQDEIITVLTLSDGADAYTEKGVYKPGGSAASTLLEGFEVDVKSVFDAGKQ